MIIDYVEYSRHAKDSLYKAFEIAFKDGYSQGVYDGAYKTEKSKGIVHIRRATKEEKVKFGEDLVGWCDYCKKPIEGQWAGSTSFCPWCGKIIDWESPKDN